MMSSNTFSELNLPEISKIARSKKTNIPKFISYYIEYALSIIWFNQNTNNFEDILSLISQNWKLSKEDQKILFFAFKRWKISLDDINYHIIDFIKKRSEDIYFLISDSSYYNEELFKKLDFSILIYAIEEWILKDPYCISDLELLKKDLERVLKIWNLHWLTDYLSFKSNYENPNLLLYFQEKLT